MLIKKRREKKQCLSLSLTRRRGYNERALFPGDSDTGAVTGVAVTPRLRLRPHVRFVTMISRHSAAFLFI